MYQTSPTRAARRAGAARVRHYLLRRRKLLSRLTAADTSQRTCRPSFSAAPVCGTCNCIGVPPACASVGGMATASGRSQRNRSSKSASASASATPARAARAAHASDPPHRPPPCAPPAPRGRRRRTPRRACPSGPPKAFHHAGLAYPMPWPSSPLSRRNGRGPGGRTSLKGAQDA